MRNRMTAALVSGGLSLASGIAQTNPKVACASLEGQKIAASAIGLPTNAATIKSAAIVEATEQTVSGNRTVLAIPEYCRVVGAISPVDPQAPLINFQVNLPTAWNRKTIQLGGSGVNGVIPGAVTNTPQFGPESLPPNSPYAISRGFVTYGSDSGHQTPQGPAGRGGGGVNGMLNIILGKPEFNAQSDLAQYREAIQEMSALYDGTDPDLSAFYKRGGKLIMKVNTADYTADPRWSYAYHDKVVETMGKRTTDQFLRLYVAVGLSHGRNVGRNPLTNESVPGFIDFIAMLDDWVEHGKAPADRQLLVDMKPVPPFEVVSSLPLCRYPQYPRFKGEGDPKKADSYTCSMP